MRVFAKIIFFIVLIVSSVPVTIDAADFHATTAQEFNSYLFLSKDNGEDDTIYLSEGVYEGGFDYQSTETFGLTIMAESNLGTEDVILDAQGNSRVILLDAGTSAADFTFQNITIQGGYGDPTGGVYIKTGGNVDFTNCVIRDNRGRNWGGGVHIDSANAIDFTGNTIASNSASNSYDGSGGGGGVYIKAAVGNVSFTGNTISNNRTSHGGYYGGSSGGAIYIMDAQGVIFTDNVFKGNRVHSQGERGNASGGSLNVTGDNITVSRNTFTENHAKADNGIGMGTAIWFSGTVSVVITDNTIVNNTAYGSIVEGIGVYGEGSDVALFLNGNDISNNTGDVNTSCYYGSDASGAGIRFKSSASSVSLENNRIQNNQFILTEDECYNGYGGGAYIESRDIRIVNNVITNNTTGYNRYGGGLYLKIHGTADIINNTISGNYSESGGGVYFEIPGSTETLNVFNNIIWGNEAVEGEDIYINGTGDSRVALNNNYNVLTGLWNVGFDNINLDPLFADPDYRLATASPCIDTGNNLAAGDPLIPEPQPVLPATDNDGNPRVLNDTVDIGAYEQLISINPSSLIVSEPNGQEIVTVRLLGEAPSSPVTVELLSTDPGEANVSSMSVTLDSNNYETGVAVNVLAVDDDTWDGTKNCTIISGAAVSEDPLYNGYNPPDVAVSVDDDDIPPLLIKNVEPNMGVVNQDLPVVIRGTGFDQSIGLYIFRRDYTLSGYPVVGDKTQISISDPENDITGTEITVTIPGQGVIDQYSLEVVKGDERYELEGAVSFLAEPQINKKAIIVAGGGPYPGNVLWNSTRLCTYKAYQALMIQGYTHDHINFLNPVTTIDIDGDGVNDVDSQANLSNLETAIKNWAKEPVEAGGDAPEELIIYMTGHGGDATFQMNVMETLTAGELDEWMDYLQNEISLRIILIYDACMSASFMELVSSPNGAERISIFSASAGQRAWFLHDGSFSFSNFFWDSVFAKGYLYQAYTDAGPYMMSNQDISVDTDGNGIKNTVTMSGNNQVMVDGVVVDDIIIGRGRVAASLSPVIQSVCDSQTAECGDTVGIWVSDINTLNGISRVWARVIPPTEVEDPTEPILALPSVPMTDELSSGKYEGEYSGFDRPGSYIVAFYAIDKMGLQSIPLQSKVRIFCGISDVIADLNNDWNLSMIDILIALKGMAGIDVAGLLRPDYATSVADVSGDNRLGYEEVIYGIQKVSGLR